MSNNLEEPKINKETTINNNLEEPKISNLEELRVNKKQSTTFVKTPECLKVKRARLNPQTHDNRYFQYSITLSSYQEQTGKKFSRPSNIKSFINNFN